nr:MAG TPA: hypothetical protein [Caudoviricetes sp.]
MYPISFTTYNRSIRHNTFKYKIMLICSPHKLFRQVHCTTLI